MAKAIRIRRAPFLILLPVQSKGQNTPQSISFGRQGGGESLRSILSLKAATKSLISSQKCSNCRSFHFDHTEALQSRWRNGEGFAARLDHSRVGPTFHQVFPSIQSERKHAWGRRRANLVRPNAAASDTLDSQGSLLPADVLADLRQKGVVRFIAPSAANFLWCTKCLKFLRWRSARSRPLVEFGNKSKALLCRYITHDNALLQRT